MSTITRRMEYVQPVEGVQPEIGRALWMIEQTRQCTNDLLDQIDPAMLDWKPDWALHATGTLLYHIALIEADWLYVEVLGTDEATYQRTMAALFPYPVRSNNALTPVEGVSLEAALERFTVVRRRLLDTFSNMTIEDFRRPRTLPESDVTPEWVLFHLSEHETEHRAEIAALHTQFVHQKMK